MARPASVSVSFPLTGDWHGTQKLLETTVKKFKGKSGDSGAGFGMRDMDFTFKTFEDAVAAEKAIMKLKIEGLVSY
jgi:hypothetical protein